jgi:two-component system cell cycle sensor histidine kinase/response regulator CckA
MTTALIVDDHSEGLYLLRCILEAEGFQVCEANNGQEALQQAIGRTLDIVISDILMPVMDGFNLCRSWRADPRLYSIPFVFYTATYVDQRDKDFALSLGADLFLVKPTDPTIFMAQVREVLVKHRAGELPTQEKPSSEAPFLQQYNEVLIHKLEEKVQELERTNKALRIKDFALASSGNGILLTNLDGNITYANPAILHKEKRQEADVLGEPVRSLFAIPTDFDTWVKQANNAPLEIQLTAKSAAQSAPWLRVEKHTVTDDQGTPLGSMLSCADVTEERSLRQALSRFQRLEALGLFADGIAHDFNNLLMAMFVGLELDASARPSVEEHEENRAMALAAFERARNLTHRLRSFAKQGSSKRRPTDLRQLLDESISLSLSGSGIQCHKRYCPSPAIANVDAGQMAQVLSNVLINARQAMQDHGTLIASVSLEPANKERIPMVKVDISDDGPGIPATILPNIFEPYFTTKKDGTGLGLATCHAIISEYGGRISADSQAGMGTTFEITLPVSKEGVPTSPLPFMPSIGGCSEHILVMDDQVAIQSFLQRGLEKNGYSVVVVGNGEQALVEYKRAKDKGQPFNLYILDIQVRGAMGGIETLSELRRLDPAVLAIAMTGNSDEASVNDMESKGFARVVAKPFLLHELQAVIKAVSPNR